MINPVLHLNPNWKSSTPKANRDGFSQSILELGASLPNLAVLTADLAQSVRVDTFADKYPDKFYEIGVAEQNLMGISAGLAAADFIPVCTSYAVFSPGRNWEQLRTSVCYSKANVKIVSSHAGLSVGPDGATHQALEDIALTRVLPNLIVVSPADFNQAQAATKAICEHIGPAYLRLSREPSLQITTKTSPFTLGQAQTLRFGDQVTLVATGLMVGEALKAAEEIDAEVINVHTIKPLDIKTIIHSTRKTGKLIIIEEHQQAGGLGSAIFEAYVAANESLPQTKHLAVKDQFGQSGLAEELFTAYGLTWEHIIKSYQDLTLKT